MVLAHAFGARYDLPVPLVYFVTGGAAVVFLSFLLVLRREVAAAAGPDEGDGSYVAGTQPVMAAVALVGLAFLVVAGGPIGGIKGILRLGYRERLTRLDSRDAGKLPAAKDMADHTLLGTEKWQFVDIVRHEDLRCIERSRTVA